MKRARQEGTPGPLVNEGEIESEATVPAQTHLKQRLTFADAQAYLTDVKDVFKDKMEKYAEFLEMVDDYRTGKIDSTAGLEARVMKLFKGHEALIVGFQAFLPEGHKTTLPEGVVKKQRMELNYALNYVTKVRMQTEEHVWESFLEILRMLRIGNLSVTKAYEEVTTLFSHHPDLVEEFTYFLPESTGREKLPSSCRPAV